MMNLHFRIIQLACWKNYYDFIRALHDISLEAKKHGFAMVDFQSPYYFTKTRVVSPYPCGGTRTELPHRQKPVSPGKEETSDPKRWKVVQCTTRVSTTILTPLFLL
jgi:hypothetical protein